MPLFTVDTSKLRRSSLRCLQMATVVAPMNLIRSFKYGPDKSTKYKNYKIITLLRSERKIQNYVQFVILGDTKRNSFSAN